MLLGPLLVLLLLGGASSASAHATLESTDPGDGSVLGRAPDRVTLTFSESVGLRDDSFRILDPGGHRVRTADAGRADGRSDTARVDLPADLGEGTYTVAWRVVSADSHPASGAFTFSVGKPSATSAPVDAGPSEDPLTATLHKTARYLAYLAAALLIGVAAFVALCRPPDTTGLRRPLAAGWWTLLGTTLALLVLRAPYEAGTGPADALDADALAGTLTSRPGVLLLARLALLAPVALLLIRTARDGRHRSPWATATGAVLAVALALTWSAGEHASAGLQVPLAMTSFVLHLLATAVWLGGLVALLTTLRTAPDAATAARFSRVALASVTVLAVTGVYQSWRGLGSWQALTGTTYGRLLLAKVALVALTLAAAAVSRRWTTALATSATPVRQGDRERERDRDRIPEPILERVPAGPPPAPEPSTGEPSAQEPSAPEPPTPGAPSTGTPSAADALRRGLRRSVLAEAVVAAVVLMVTTVLTSTVPGRAADEAARSAPAGGVLPASVTDVPFDLGDSARGTVQITLDPGRTGDNAVQAVVFGPDGALAAVPELRLSFTLPDKDIGPIEARLVDRGGYWSANTLTLPLPGTWTMRTTVRVSEIDQVTESRRIRIES
ncbi:copper resistance CopC/CopD family protein [Streptomyces parvulus]|uniref:Protein YobA n=1 Tax=Streptomyces parvulus TaxID=146923 RepID=A0A369V7K9_9ACTN|nr:copper resistance protein CopC [Streptomyces parvulus]RDD89022.1 transporter [Streptomyces parvulus]